MINGEFLCGDAASHERAILSLHEGLVSYCIDRRNAEVPDTYVPSAKLIAIAKIEILRFALPKIRYTKYRWTEFERNRLFKTFCAEDYSLVVRRYGENWGCGETWGVEREQIEMKIHEVLAFAFGPTPIFFCHDVKAAMALARACHPTLPENASCLRWMPIAA